MRNLDEKWVAKISDGHRDNVEFLLRKNRDCNRRTKGETKGHLNSKSD
jgi:hypothetical protein